MKPEAKEKKRERRIYTSIERRKVLASVYQIINTQAMVSRYSSTTFGMSIDDDPNAPEALGIYNLIECIAQMHNELSAAEMEEAPRR